MILALNYPILWILLFLIIVIYSFWSFRKVYSAFRNYNVGLLGIVLQFITDFIVIKGFIIGIYNKIIKNGY